MTENRDASSGQFTAESEPLTGQAGLEAEHGFTPLASLESQPDDGEFGNAEDAAAAFTDAGLSIDDSDVAMQVRLAEPMSVQMGNLQTGEQFDENVTVPVETAGEHLAALQSDIGRDLETYVNADFAEQIDRMRADVIKNDPALAEHYGVEMPKVEATAEPTAEAKVAEPAADPNDPDPEFTKAINHPKIADTIAQEWGKAEESRAQYQQGLNTAHLMAQAAFTSSFPELASLPGEHIEAGLRQLANTNPQRFQQAMGLLNQANQLQIAQQQEVQRQQQQQQHIQRQQFASYAKEQDARFLSMMGGDESSLESAAKEIATYAAELGVDQGTLVRLWNTEPLMRHVAFQKMMVDAARYNSLKKNPPKATPKPLPPVLKPGHARSAADSRSSNVNALAARLNKTGSIDDAFALFNARQSA